MLYSSSYLLLLFLSLFLLYRPFNSSLHPSPSTGSPSSPSPSPPFPDDEDIVVGFNVAGGWEMTPSSYSFNHLATGKSYFQNTKFHVKQEYPSGFFKWNVSGNCSLLFTVSDLMRSQGTMERDCTTLDFVQFYKNAPFLNPQYYIFPDAHGNLVMADFAYVGKDFINDFYWVYLDRESGVAALVKKASHVGGSDCFVDDFALDIEQNEIYLICTTHNYSTYYISFSLDKWDIVQIWPEWMGPSFTSLVFYDSKLYGFWEGESADLHNFGYYDLKLRKNVKVDYYRAPGVTYTVQDVSLIQETGMLYATLQVYFNNPGNLTRYAVNYWLVIDIPNRKTVYLEPTGMPRETGLNSFGIISKKNTVVTKGGLKKSRGRALRN